MAKRMTRIELACQVFINSLGSKATDKKVFITLDEVARKNGLELRAQQNGIAGTFVHFVEGSGQPRNE